MACRLDGLELYLVEPELRLVLGPAPRAKPARRLALLVEQAVVTADLPAWQVAVVRPVLPELPAGAGVVAPAERVGQVPGFSACCRCQSFRLSFRRTVFQKNCHSWLEQSHKFFEAGFTGKQ